MRTKRSREQLVYSQILHERLYEYDEQESYDQVDFDGLKTLKEIKEIVEELIKLEEA